MPQVPTTRLVVQKPRLFSDNGASYVATDLVEYFEDKTWTMFVERHTTRKPNAVEGTVLQWGRANPHNER